MYRKLVLQKLLRVDVYKRQSIADAEITWTLKMQPCLEESVQTAITSRRRDIYLSLIHILRISGQKLFPVSAGGLLE